MSTSSAPGKIILSGEHSVVYGAPALAFAVKQRLNVSFTPDPLPRLSWFGPDSVHELALEKFSTLRHKLDAAFEGYLKGERSISEIISRPAELIFYTVDIARMLGNLERLPRGKVKIESEIPVGAGMGSSAALLAALLALFSRQRSPEQLIEQVRHCERLQHGRGSLIDAATVCLGGLVRVESDKALRMGDLPKALGQDWYWIFTGTPATSTGVCVDRVRSQFADSSIWSEFSDVTAEIGRSLDSSEALSPLIKVNHRLLSRIGVVPSRVNALVEKIEDLGGAAKISGAGAVSGDAGGLVLAYLPSCTPEALSLPLGSRWGTIAGSNTGVIAHD
ncbi:mevalonate kinase [Marinobacterium sp. LSUCC0821]|uniref:mevalonate kinase family protein n=1 Tax=Marinobacterium sp. LSUCC0821 TaxID=2668067 RepID=UPI001451E094|nr:mevalonate kinase [Marinobacterium sp. LSUCC0821]QJD70460.1 mevalonate kinase [Marinobacterium sp. LSUCC0821]